MCIADYIYCAVYYFDFELIIITNYYSTTTTTTLLLGAWLDGINKEYTSQIRSHVSKDD